jgi:hypothetical protein
MNGHRQTAPACPVGANNGLMHRSNFLTFDHLVSTVEQRFGMVRALGHTTFANRLSVRAGTETDFVG